jgi:DNA-binding winged helix-turn-helix (wHTH) protein/uncharacterized DUF497 family protein
MPSEPLSSRPQAVRFGSFEMDFDALELKKCGLRVKLQEQPFRILKVLVLQAGETVSRDELYANLSSHRDYDPKQALHNAIQKIREALNDSANSPRFIETMGRGGYRFIAQVEVIANGAAHGKTCPAGDTFELELRQIRRQLFLATSESELLRLYYHVAGLAEQYASHPEAHEAHFLRDSVWDALTPRQETSREVFARVFDDPNAISVRLRGTNHWQTIGSVGQSVIVTVDHTMHHENNREVIRIISGRKATQSERTFYERNKKKP